MSLYCCQDTHRYHKYLCVSVSFSGFLFFFFFSNFGNPAKKRCRRNPETVIYVNTFIVDFTVYCVFDCS